MVTRYLCKNIIKEVEDLYEILKKETEVIRRWKDLPCSWIGRINIVKMAVLPKIIYRFNVMSIISNIILFRNRKINPKIHMKA
jgi:hypothetical protein